MKIGIFGGTFDPPHLGHMEAARAAIEHLKLDIFLFMPAGTPPHKNASGGATPEQRLEMVQLMADGLYMPDKVQVSKMEMERIGRSYTVDTLCKLRKEFPEDELWLLVGTDMFLSLPDWKEPEKIMKMVGIAAVERTTDQHGTTMEEQANMLREKYQAKVELVPLSRVIELSSTEIRDQGTGDGLWPPVWGYILRKQLYNVEKPLTGLNLPDLRAVSWSMIRAKRIPHVHGTEEEAVHLAKRWNADEYLASRAAILHDCTKYFTMEEHIRVCEKYHVELDQYELENEKLLHAKSGAALARELFGETEEVVQAIMWHTTGKVGMTLLEKVLYLADYIEPTRNFPGVEPLRDLAYDDLDRALLLGAEMSIEDAENAGRPLHPDTQRLRDSLVEEEEKQKYENWKE